MPVRRQPRMRSEIGQRVLSEADQLPLESLLDEIKREIDIAQPEETLNSEGTAKFADPHKALPRLIAETLAAL